jgi:glutaredoxin-dependent peroxiredoxin
MIPQTGQQAPDFTLFDSDRKQVSLHDYKGKKVVLLFFPFAFSSTCTKEMCHVRDHISRFNQIDAQVLGISVDSLYTLAKFREDQQLNFTLLSDFNKEVSRAYGSLHEEFNYNMKGVSKRSAFVIDRDGVLRYAAVQDNPGQMPDFGGIEAALSSID